MKKAEIYDVYLALSTLNATKCTAKQLVRWSKADNVFHDGLLSTASRALEFARAVCIEAINEPEDTPAPRSSDDRPTAN
jgi:hypothetical protein